MFHPAPLPWIHQYFWNFKSEKLLQSKVTLFGHAIFCYCHIKMGIVTKRQSLLGYHTRIHGLGGPTVGRDLNWKSTPIKNLFLSRQKGGAPPPPPPKIKRGGTRPLSPFLPGLAMAILQGTLHTKMSSLSLSLLLVWFLYNSHGKWRQCRHRVCLFFLSLLSLY